MIRFGLCCIFKDQPIKFATTTAKYLLTLSRQEQLKKLSTLCLANARALLKAFEFCLANNIGCFRIVSQILPLKTHPQISYDFNDLPDGDEIVSIFKNCGDFLQKNPLRASLHPDQFVVLNSPNPDVVKSSIAEIEYQAEIAELTGADVINIHGGGAYGDKKTALQRFAENFQLLSKRAKTRLTLENDDKVYSPEKLLPLCRQLSIPLVYDVHHHRCLTDGLSIEQATKKALKTWNREPLFHLSSPLEGWQGAKPHRHHDFIDPTDFPDCWKDLEITVEIEAKAKEIAVIKLMDELKKIN